MSETQSPDPGRHASNAPPPAGRRERKKEQTRQALLDAAIENFASRGMSATRIEDITESADVGKGAFYNYFESKDALVAELVARGTERLLSADVSGTAIGGGATPAERARTLVAAHSRFFTAHPEFHLLFHQARGMIQLRDEEHARLRQVFRGYLARVGEIVFGPDAGIDPDRKLSAAAALVGLVTGSLSFRVAAGLEPADADVAVELAARGLERALGLEHGA